MAKKPKPPAEAKIERWNIDDLRPHEKQADFFLELPEEELDRLADSIERNGLKTPPDVVPDGRIIAGYRRVTACERRLGWTEIDVRVRYDLEGDEDAIERELLSDNFDRRQLNPVEMACAFRRLMEIEKGRSKKKRGGKPQGDLRDRVAGQFGMSGRHLKSLEKLLDTPEEVRRAVVQKLLAVTKAPKIAALDTKTQRRLAKEIADCYEQESSDKAILKRRIKRVVDQCLRENAAKSNKPKKSKKPGEGVKRFVEDLEKALDGIGRELDSQPRLKLTVSLKKLKRAQNKFNEIVQEAESRGET